ncbi:MAG: hypothetical protein ACKVHE_01530 [Planctomycetales bacterium]|jgi:hypothetical protein
MSGSEADSRSRSILPHRLEWLVLGTGRGIALFFGAFSLLNLGGELIHPGFDASGWWLDVRGVLSFVSQSLILAFAVLMFEFVRQPESSRTISRLQKLAVAGAFLIAIRDTWTFHDLLSRDVITTHFPLPFSLLVAVLLLVILTAMHIRVREDQSSFRGKAPIAAAALRAGVPASADPLFRLD